MIWKVTATALLALCASAAEHTVCTAQNECDYSDLQAALDAAQPGDILTLRAGDTFSRAGGFMIRAKSGDGWLRIRSSRMNELKEGHRVGPEQAAAGMLAKILVTRSADAGLFLEPARQFATVNTTADTLNVTAHGYKNGTPVQIQGAVGSPYVCTGTGIPFANADCAEGKAGAFNVRGRTGLANGHSLRLFGLTLPEPFQKDTIYYVVNSTDGASSRFQLSATPGGEPIIPTTTGAAFSYEATPDPLRQGEILYVINATANTFQVARSVDDPPLDLKTAGVVYGQNGYAPGVAVRSANKVEKVILEGLEVTVQPGIFAWVLLMLGDGPFGPEAMPRNIVLDRSYIHGNPGEMGPHQCVYVNATDVSISNSTVNECKSNYADAQAILVLSSAGGIQVENNRLEASGETIMFGGAYPSYTGLTPDGALIRRNYFTKPLYWRAGMYTSVADGQTVRVKQWARGELCSVAASQGEGGQCFVYDKEGKRHAYTTDLTMTAPVGTGRVLFMYDNGLKAVHNLQSLACSEGIECVQQSTTPAWPSTATRLQEVAVSNNAFTTVTTQYPVVKNAFEVKHGKNMVLEGNIMEHAWHGAQSSLIVLNAQATSTLTEPVNYWAASSDIVVRNNILRKAAGVFSASGRSYQGGRPEVLNFGFGGRTVLANNLIMDSNWSKWSHMVWAGSSTMAVTKQTDVLVQHNTFAGVEWLLRYNDGEPKNDFINIQDNIVIPRPGLAFPGVFGDGTVSWQHAKTVKQNVNGIMARNVLLNTTGTTANTRPNIDYPADTWLISGAHTPESVGFIDWTGGNFRLRPDSPFSARCSSGCTGKATTGRDLGADIDEIQALTNGVEEGLPEWSRRAGVTTIPSATTAILQWNALEGQNCQVRVYPDSTYAQLIPDVDPSVDSTRSGESRTTLADGMRQFVIGQFAQLQPQTRYHYKLFCGYDIAVGSFETTASTAMMDIKFNPPAGTVAVAPRLGTQPDALVSASEVPCGPEGCSLSVPAGQFFQWTYRKASGERSGSKVHMAR